MKFCITNRKEIGNLIDKSTISDLYSEYKAYPFLPVGLLIDELEKRKKKGQLLPQQMIEKLEQFPQQITTISLTGKSLESALKDEEFNKKFVSSQSNPFALISEVCLYDDSVKSWVDGDELVESLHQIQWI